MGISQLCPQGGHHQRPFRNGGGKEALPGKSVFPPLHCSQHRLFRMEPGQSSSEISFLLAGKRYPLYGGAVQRIQSGRAVRHFNHRRQCIHPRYPPSDACGDFSGSSAVLAGRTECGFTNSFRFFSHVGAGTGLMIPSYYQ